MANNVTATQLGGQAKVYNDVDTVQDIMDKLDISGVSIKVNGETVDANHELSDYEFVTFGEKVKGGGK